MNNKELIFRYSEETDEKQIRELVESRFGNRDGYGVYEDLEGRYFVAVNEERQIIAMTGLRDSKLYRGLEVDWTCVSKGYEGNGLITRMLGHLLQEIRKDVYCSCWRWNQKQINLKNAMESLRFQAVLEPRLTYHSEYTDCERICIAFNPCEGKCICYEDLYVRKYMGE